MLRSLVGPETYRSALDLYFERHDGQACTIEDWLAVFEDASGRDLAQFKRWYAQAGTPRVKATESWNGALYALTLSQTTPPTPGQPVKEPLVIPVAFGLLGPDGDGPRRGRARARRARAALRVGAPRAPGRLAPPRLLGAGDPRAHDHARGARLPPRPRQRPLQQVGGRPRLRAHAPRPPRRRPAPPTSTPPTSTPWPPSPTTPRLDPAFKALALGLPSEEEIISDIAAAGGVPDPLAVHRARRALEGAVAAALGDRAARLHADNAVPGPYSPDADRRRPPRPARPRARAT